MGKGGHHTDLFYPVQVPFLLLLLSRSPKTLPQAASWKKSGGTERRGKSSVEATPQMLLQEKVSTHQSFSRLQNQRPLMNAWEYLESFALLKKLTPGQFLDYIFRYNTSQHILSQRFLQFTLSCPSFLSKVRFYGSVAGKATQCFTYEILLLMKACTRADVEILA